MLFDVARQALTDRAALSECGCRAVRGLVEIGIDIGASVRHHGGLRRVRRHRIDAPIWRHQPFRQTLRERMGNHPPRDESAEGGLHQKAEKKKYTVAASTAR